MRCEKAALFGLFLAACASRRDNSAVVEALVRQSGERSVPKFELKVERVETELPEQRKEYRLGVNDLLQVSVVGHPEFSGSPGSPGFRVQPDGSVHFPMVSLQAAGRTVGEVRTSLLEALREYLKEPQASVEIVRYESQKFYVLGAVGAPGAFPVDGDTTLLEGLALAGGPRDNGDLEGAYVIRGRALLPVSLGDLVLRGDTSRNVLMQDGDFVYVPLAADWKVFVLGEVRAPGSVSIPQRTGLNLAAAIAAVGGIDPLYGKKSGVTVYRGSWQRPELFTLHIEDVYRYGTSIALRPGDRVVVAPKGLASYNRVLTLLLPILQSPLALAVTTGAVGG